MQIFSSIEALALSTDSAASCALTIGNFDSVHLGHQMLLHSLRKKELPAVVLTFSNSPSEILYNTSVPTLISLPHRLALLSALGIEKTLLLPFTRSFSQLSPRQFLTDCKKFIGFSHLVLGHDAVIGHQREGGPEHLFALSQELSFSLEYLEPIRLDGEIISSSLIRRYLREGHLVRVSQLLGRPYSIYTSVIRGAGKGKAIGYPTANLAVSHFYLPPQGVYAIRVHYKEQIYYGVANLGNAPTVHRDRPLLLEVHLFDFNRSLYDQEIEVEFLEYIRPEQHFSSLQDLKKQIDKDLLIAHTIATRTHAMA